MTKNYMSGMLDTILASKLAAEKKLQELGARGVRPVLNAIAHIPAAMFSTPGIKKRK